MYNSKFKIILKTLVMGNLLMFCVFALFCAISCEVKVDTGKKSAEEKTSDSKGEKSSNSNIRNGVKLNEKGLKVDQAFLIFLKDGNLVPADNKVEVGQQVGLRLILHGWKEENGKVFPGTSEKISTSDGDVLLDEKDLFSSYTDGVSPKDAGIITISATITKLDKLYDHFLISFRVWDKKGENEVAGSYKLYIK
jgi:hypothetical protein